MAKTAADILVETLIDWGVEVIFGLPGDGINGIMESLRTRRDKIRFVQVRHEESAAFMACGYAKYTKKLGCCLATSGPGGVHLLNGLYDAKMDGAPVLAITGHHYHDLIDTMAQQDVALDRLFMDVAAYNTRVMGPEHVANVTQMACRTAVARRAVTHINFPADLQSLTVEDGSRSSRNVPKHDRGSYYVEPPTPQEAHLKKAAEVLNSGKKVVMLVGQGALGCTKELLEVADILGAPIVKALLGKAAVPDHHPLTTGGIGLLGTLPSENAMQECDTLLMVGTSFPYIEYYPKPGQAKCVQIDIEPARIGLRYPVEVGLPYDSKSTLRGLKAHLKRQEDRSFLEQRQKETHEWWQLMEKRGTRQDKPMKPQVVAWELGKRLRDDAIITSDSGTIATWFARQIPAKGNQMFSLSGNLATMANGLPYTIAAQVAHPDRQCVAFIGDGGFSMLMAEFATAVRYELPIKVILINNGTLGQIKWEQMVFLGNPEFEVDLAPIDFAKVAEACGGVGLRCDDPARIGEVLDQALAYPGPVLVDAIVDKQEPPMPSKIKVGQATKFAKSMLRGEKYREEIVTTVARDKVKEMI
ncbi:MAG: thiamine pyrophosphate-binding protein [Verrucomicrobiota bacterium JB022]|nr:thiamine pyrophosphate-binding protein [Verrucomicrobiota bacterium JB022]